MIGFHHLRLRKRATDRIKKGLEPFPAKGLGKRLLDYLMYGVAVASPFALLPQVLRVLADGDVSGLVLSTWVLLACANCLWLLYSLVHREWHIFIANFITGAMNISIAVGVFLYGGN